MKVIISGGGTGGHIFPAIAIAQEIKSRVQDADILFVGANGKMEMEKVPQAGFKIIGLDVAGLQRKSFLKNMGLPFKVIKSLIQAYSILKSVQPEIVVGVGGYASGPILYMAHWLKIPTLIQEQNSYAGITNKILGKRASKICVAYQGMEKFFEKDKIVLTGNPVRKDLSDLPLKRMEAAQYFQLDGDKKTVLVMGGSLGAKTLNETMISNLSLIQSNPDIQWIWQYGKQGQLKYGDTPYGKNIKGMAFIERTDLAYAIADVVLCRAGALTISEVLVANKPCILVPSPNVAEDHQTHNARALTDQGAAIMIQDDDCNVKAIRMVLELIDDATAMELMSKAQTSVARPQAAALIVDELFKLIPKAA
ncbi:MAG: undecaprenyldiphospho-muramoylpentapeptide beta-N-acetylglucosaminyltransferase [Saprospiraceae bacterium]|nr:undecaprenyldiphospho-muramoylpentapeptide beta-N-acetylglucosaminyltransferase [Saprospiraceae bacterium]MBP8095089.1 undecaprenyldiphospho-muramoylpentapeptide beta-N-acetylglucosaminyltransferase [Saprospiraceae bacterium]